MNDFSNISAESDLKDLMTITPTEQLDLFPQPEPEQDEYEKLLDQCTNQWQVTMLESGMNPFGNFTKVA